MIKLLVYQINKFTGISGDVKETEKYFEGKLIETLGIKKILQSGLEKISILLNLLLVRLQNKNKLPNKLVFDSYLFMLLSGKHKALFAYTESSEDLKERTLIRINC